jgi:hypothetical protein
MGSKKTNPVASSPKQQPTAPLGDRGGDKTWERAQGEQTVLEPRG